MTRVMVNISLIRDRIRQIEAKRETLVALLEEPSLGTLHIDVNQAIEELDDLVAEFKRTFGEYEVRA
jgi:hypothetical protein